MFKLTIERVDPQTEIRMTRVYLTEAQRKLAELAGVTCTKRDERWMTSDDDRERAWQADLPVVDFRRSIESKIYEQVLESLDIAEIIKAANKLK